MSGVPVACCQVAPVLRDLAVNRDLAAESVAGAASLGARVVVLPELLSSGYVFESKWEARECGEPRDGPMVSLLTRLATDLGLIVVGGFCELAGDELFNSAAVVDGSGLRAVYRKAHLWDAERLWFTAGDASPVIVPTEVGDIAVMICYDLEFPEWVRLPALAGAQLLCAPVNWPASPRPDGERPAEIVRVQAGASVNRIFVAACDRAGQERGVDWVEGSVIVDPDGWPLAGGSAGTGVHTIVADCRLGDAKDKSVSSLSDVMADRRPGLYGRVTEEMTSDGA